MKVEIVIDEKYQETYVKIFTDKYNKEIENLEKSLVNINNNVILGFKDDNAFVLDLKNIYRFFTEDKDVFIECRDNTYKSRLRGNYCCWVKKWNSIIRFKEKFEKF